MTPGASANSALIFANSEWIGVKDSYKYTTYAVVCGALIALALLPVLMRLFQYRNFMQQVDIRSNLRIENKYVAGV